MSFTLPTPSLEIQHAGWGRFQRRDDGPHGTEWLLEFPAPGKLWSSNHRTSPMAAATYRKTWREAAARWGNGINPGEGPWLIMFGLPFRRNSARRDPHNWTGTVVKAVLDGLGPPGRTSPGAGWWVDDDETRIRVLDSYTYVTKPPLTVAVHGFRLDPGAAYLERVTEPRELTSEDEDLLRDLLDRYGPDVVLDSLKPPGPS